MQRRKVYIGLGGNLGSVPASMRAALRRLEHEVISIEAVSSLYSTPPWGGVAQPAFLNAAACLATPLPAEALLNLLLSIELSVGRNRANEKRWGPRILDLDILFDEGVPQLDTPSLILPHPRLTERLFVLYPLAEIAGAAMPTRSGPSVSHLLATAKADNTADALAITKLDLPWWP